MMTQAGSRIESHESRRRLTRSFTRGLALAALSLVSLMLAGCGGGGDGGGGAVASATPVMPRFAYVANQFDDTVSIYAVDAASGQLRSLGYVAVGNGPTSVTVDSSGRFAYVANQGGTVSAFTINGTTGVLTAAGTFVGVPPATGPRSIVTSSVLQ